MAGTVSGGATGIASNSAWLIGRAPASVLGGHAQRQQHRPLAGVDPRPAPLADQPHVAAVPQQHPVGLVEHPPAIRQVGLPVDHRHRHRLRRARAERLGHRVTHQPRRRLRGGRRFIAVRRTRECPTIDPRGRASISLRRTRSGLSARPAISRADDRFSAGYNVSPTRTYSAPVSWSAMIFDVPADPAGLMNDQNSAPRQNTDDDRHPGQHRHPLTPARLGLHPHLPARHPQRRTPGHELMRADLNPRRVAQSTPTPPTRSCALGNQRCPSQSA